MAATPAPTNSLSANPEEEEPRKKAAKSKLALLRSVQKTFAYLQGSNLRYFNPRALVASTAQVKNAFPVFSGLSFTYTASLTLQLKLSDGHLNQNDAAEFYGLLMDYFEDCFKGRPEREELMRLLFSKNSVMNVRHCPHRHMSESSETRPYSQLLIRTGLTGTQMHSLKEAFEECYRSNEVSDLECDVCNQSLPPNTKVRFFCAKRFVPGKKS